MFSHLGGVILKSKKNTLYNLLIVILIGVICYSGWNLYGIYSNYKEGDSMYEATRNEFMLPVEEGGLSVSSGGAEEIPLNKRIDLEKLIGVNDDVLGWIYIPDTPVDYPLLMPTIDNDEYLYTAYDKKYSGFGSIFIDFRNNGLTDENTVIHGHNMQNGAMFGELTKYGKSDYADEHRFIYILTENGVEVYEVYSAYRTVVESDSYSFRFDTENAYQNFINSTINNSVIDNQVEVTVMDRLITLSTCTDTGRTVNRFVVHAKYVETKSEES